MVKVDFHVHTRFSPDSLTSLEAALRAARRRGLARLAITDHNTIAGALEACRLAPDFVIVGEEVMTTEGELLAYFLTEEVPAGLPPEEALARLRAQGAFVAAAHPFDARRKGHWSRTALERIAPWLDAVEGFNARCFSARANRLAVQFAAEHGLLLVAGSDAHTAAEIGRAAMLLPEFEPTAAGLRAALREGRAVGAVSPPWVVLASRYAKWRGRFGRVEGR